jgi:hypothetical protein
MAYLGALTSGLSIFLITSVIPKTRKTKYFPMICLSTVSLFTALFYYMAERKYEMPWPIVLGFAYGLFTILTGVLVARDKNKAAEKSARK